MVIIAAYFPRFTHVLDELKRAGITLVGKTVIDITNPLNVDADFNHYHAAEYMRGTSTTEDIQRTFPLARVIKTFSTVPAQLLDVERWGSTLAPAMMYVGGDASTEATVRTLIRDAGFRPCSAGYHIEDARLLEKMGVLLHSWSRMSMIGI